MASFKVSASASAKQVQFQILRPTEDGIPEVVCNHVFTPSAAIALGKRLFACGESLVDRDADAVREALDEDVMKDLKDLDDDEGDDDD